MVAQRSPDFETYGHCNQAGAFHHTEGTVLVSVPHGAHAADAKPGTMLVFSRKQWRPAFPHNPESPAIFHSSEKQQQEQSRV